MQEPEAMNTGADEPSSAEPSRRKRSHGPLVIVGVVIGLMALLLTVISVTSGGVGQKESTPEGVTKILGKVDPNATAVIPIQLKEGGDIDHEADHVFEPIETLGGIRKATLMRDGSGLRVEFDSGQIAEADIRLALQRAEYLPGSAGGQEQ